MIKTETKTLISGCQNSTIPTDGSVTSIGEYAFYGCSSLSSITIPDSVTSIGGSAFSGCSSLTSMTLPFVGGSKDDTSKIRLGYIFGADRSNYNQFVPSSLKEVIITGGSIIADYTFRNCTSLTSITIGNGVISIGYEAFYGCSSLTSVTIPDSVTSIGDEAFYKCSSLTSITIPDSVTSIGDDAFYKCSSLTSITIPDSVTSIGDDAFYGCSSLTSINYTGSKDDWYNLTYDDLGLDMNEIIVHCTDGDCVGQVIGHLSFDELRIMKDGEQTGEFFTPGYSENWDGSADLSSKDTKMLQYWGWVGIFQNNVGTFGYQVGTDDPIFDGEFTANAESNVVYLAQNHYGCKTATRMQIDIDLTAYTGTQTVKTLYKDGFGTIHVLTEFTAILP